MVRRKTLLLTSRPVKVAVIATGRIQKTHARPLQIHQNEFPLKTSRLLPRIKIEKNGHERQPRNRSHPIQQKQQKQHLHLVRKLQHRILWLAQTVKIGRASQAAIAHPAGNKIIVKDSGKHEMRLYQWLSMSYQFEIWQKINSLGMNPCTPHLYRIGRPIRNN